MIQLTPTMRARTLLFHLANELESGERKFCRKKIRTRRRRANGPAFARCTVGLIQDGVSLETDFGRPVYPSQLKPSEYKVADKEKLAVARAAERLIARALGRPVRNRAASSIELDVIGWTDGIYTFSGHSDHPTRTADVVRVFRKAANLW